MSGIFRDVYILKRPEQGIFDYFIKTEHTEISEAVKVDITYFGELVPTTVTLYDAEGKVLGTHSHEADNESHGPSEIYYVISFFLAVHSKESSGGGFSC